MGNPEDEYEISEACDDEEDCMEKDRSHKHVPAWSLTYTENIKKQAYTDPDTIFGPSVPKVSMDDIFTEANYAEVGFRRPNRRRGSSADWRRDELKKDEITIYKTKMEQSETW